MKVLEFEPRFVRKLDLHDLSELWHLSRVPHGLDKHKRMCWAAAEFAKTHSYVSSTGAYKDLCDMLEFGGR